MLTIREFNFRHLFPSLQWQCTMISEGFLENFSTYMFALHIGCLIHMVTIHKHFSFGFICTSFLRELFIHHWYPSVLNKWFLTPFRDVIWNRRLVSDGDRAGPSHMTQKPSGICPPGTNARQNEVVCDRWALKYRNAYNTAKKYNCTTKLFPVASTSHTVSTC